MTRRLSTTTTTSTTTAAAATTTLTYASGGKKIQVTARRFLKRAAYVLSEHFTDFVSREPIERYRGETKRTFKKHTFKKHTYIDLSPDIFVKIAVGVFSVGIFDESSALNL